MTLDELIIIKKAADVMRVDRNILGAAVMYNVEYVSVRNQHVLNFKTVIYNKVKNLLYDCLTLGEVPGVYKGKFVFNGESIPHDDPWFHIKTLVPISEQVLQDTTKLIKKVDSSLECATDSLPVVQVSNPTDTGIMKRLFNKVVKGLW